MAEPLARPTDPGTVDADNPWPGLASFREADRELFFGREVETQELLRLALRERLTILFGLSGLGKTSLLRAGLFPLLRQENILPVYLRLDLSESEGARRTLTGQVRQAIAQEATEAGIEVPAFSETETLWESLHRQGAELWSPRNRIVTPLLVFDQFEEVFTLGRRNAARAQEAEAFLTELADLCEGSVPAALRERLEADPAATREFSFTRHPYKILLSLREDFLPELEGLRGRIRSIVQNRFRLRRMNGDNALRVITQAGGHLVEPDVPERIVRFVAGQEIDGELPLAEMEIEPALLSVVCRELNNKRRAQGLPRITADLVRGNRDEILSDLYERSVDDLGPDVRSFIEERLLTKSGFRDSVALENAVEQPGVTREALDKLTDRRLLRIEDRGGMQRLELTHDVLTGVIRRSRDLRREQEARLREEEVRREAERRLRRSRRVLFLLALVLVGVAIFAGWGFNAQREAREALAGSDVGRASFLRDSNPRHALAYLARAIRSEPESAPAQSLLIDLLLYKSWPRLDGELRFDDADAVDLSEDGRLFAAITRQGTVALWDTRTLQQIGKEIEQSNVVDSLDISRDGRRILILSAGAAQLWDTGSGKSLKNFELGEKSSIALSPDGRWLAFSRDGTSLVLQQIDTNVEHRISFPAYPPELAEYGGYGNLGFSPDSRRIFAHDGIQILLWDVESGAPLAGPPADMTRSARFSPDSRHLLTTGARTTIWNLAGDGPPAGDPFEGDADEAWLSPRGEKLVTYNAQESLLRIWRSRDARKPLAAISKRNLVRAEVSPDGRLLLTTSDDGVELWDATTGLPVSQPLCDCPQGRFQAGTRRIATGDDNGTLRTWRPEPVRTGTELLPDPDRKMSAVFSPDQSRLAVRTGDGRVHLWDTEAVQPVGIPIPIPTSSFFGLSPGGRFLVELTEKNAILVWETQTGHRLWEPLPIPAGSRFFPGNSSLGLSPVSFEKKIAGIQSDRTTVQLRSLENGELAGEVKHDPEITGFAFSPDGERLVTVSSRGGVRRWDATGHSLGDELVHESRITSLDFSPDGRRLATGTQKGLARIWDLQSGELLQGPFRNRHSVTAVRFQLADRLLVSARDALKVWNLETERAHGGVLDQKGNISYAELGPSGDRLLVETDEEPVRLLDVRTGNPLFRTAFTNPQAASLNPAGQLLWIADAGVHVYVVPRFPAGDAELLARWAEAIGGCEFDEDDRLADLTDQLFRIGVLRHETEDAPPGQLGAASLIRWFFLSDPKARTASPVFDHAR